LLTNDEILQLRFQKGMKANQIAILSGGEESRRYLHTFILRTPFAVSAISLRSRLSVDW
jgi:hypothetical protein